MTQAQPSSAYAIPDFDADDADVRRYNEALHEFEKRTVEEGERRVRAEYAQKLEAVRAELGYLKALRDEREERALQQLRAYGERYPSRVAKAHALPPSLLENLLSLGSAHWTYRKVYDALLAVQEADSVRRKKEYEEEQIDIDLKRALKLREDESKARIGTEEWLAEFHGGLLIQPVWRRVQAIREERASFEERMKSGLVPDEELRDRTFARRGVIPLELPFEGLMMLEFLPFGRLAYILLKDLEGRLHVIPYDERLMPLRDGVLDFFRLANRFEVRFRTQFGGKQSFTKLDHFIATYADKAEARDEYRKHRLAFARQVGGRDTPPLRPLDKLIVEMLAKFAQTAPEVHAPMV